jgi:CHAT domain-containing protein
MINLFLLLSFLLVFQSYAQVDSSRSYRRSGERQLRESDNIPLTWSKYELNQVSGFASGDFYYGKDASEDIFKKEAHLYRILHLASHTVVNDSLPDLSYLSFSPEDKIEDGRLNVFEIYNQKISAEMIILSSCNTGLGKIINGEGAISMARAFMYAGCPSIIMSLWDIDDRATSEVVVSFYESLFAGKSKDESLREAKLKYLGNADQYTANPLYWGGLVSIGQQANISVDKKKSGWVLPVIISILLLLTAITIQRSRIKNINMVQSRV